MEVDEQACRERRGAARRGAGRSTNVGSRPLAASAAL